MNKLNQIEFTQQLSKVKQLSDAICAAISNGEFVAGESLPSINQISQYYTISRDTVFKAFLDLKSRGIVDSAPTKGYYVKNIETKILLLLDIYSPYKTELYNSLKDNLPSNCKIDLHFHYNDEQIMTKIIDDSVGRYSFYLVMNCSNDKFCEVIDKLPTKRVMLLDFGKFEKQRFSFACQGFDQTLYNCLCSGLDHFKKYEEIILVLPHTSEHPKSCIPYFQQFCQDHNFRHALAQSIDSGDIRKGTAYLIVNHRQMINFVKDCRQKNLNLGSDVGVVVFNDEPVYEILDCGISVISTNFKAIGELAAQFVVTLEPIQTYVETKLIMRGSL